MIEENSKTPLGVAPIIENLRALKALECCYNKALSS